MKRLRYILPSIAFIFAAAFYALAGSAPGYQLSPSTTPAASTITSTMILDGEIVNADINASAAIADSKLAQITTASKVSTTAITGTLGVANGGTGAATLTANNVILGNGTSAVAFVAPSTSGNVLTSNGTTWTSAAAAGGTDMTTKQYYECRSNVGLTTALGVGMGNPSTSATSNANNDQSDYHFVRNSTSGTNGNALSVISAAYFKRCWLADCIMVVRTGPDITNTRLFVGLLSGDPSAADTATNLNCACFRYSTGADGAGQWAVVTNDGGVTATVSTNVGAIAIDTTYVLRIKLLASSVEYYINGALVKTETTDLPTSTTAMSMAHYLTILATETAKQFSWSRMMVLQN